MHTTKNYGGLDRFRVAAAILVIAIHTSPLTSINESADFFLTRVLARIAVPFFLMVTGQFVAARFLDSPPGDSSPLKKYLTKTFLLYIVCILLYLPIGIYAGHYREITAAEALRMLVFDGTFYHLWYFPAAILGILLVYLMSRFLSLRSMTVVSGILYVIGLFGDSYYGIALKAPVLESVYGVLFQISSYTRNGLFFAPLFLVMGAWTGVRAQKQETLAQEPLTDRQELWSDCVGLVFSFAILSGEAFVLRFFECQRHDSMYVMLVPTMYFLYQCLSAPHKECSKGCRIAAMWIYILHPGFIVVVRAMGKALGHTELLVENSLIHFICVTLLSVMAGYLIALIHSQFSFRNDQKKREIKIAEICDLLELEEQTAQSSFEEPERFVDGETPGQAFPDLDDLEVLSAYEDTSEQALPDLDDLDAASAYEDTSEQALLDFDDSGAVSACGGPPEQTLLDLADPEAVPIHRVAPEKALSNLSDPEALAALSAHKDAPEQVSAKTPVLKETLPRKTAGQPTPRPSVTVPEAVGARRTTKPSGNGKAAGASSDGSPSNKPAAARTGLRAWIELDPAALKHNVDFLRSMLPESCRLMPAVKAEAYGHGGVIISRMLNQMGVDAFCVACLAEGIALREAGIQGEILILGYTPPEDFPLLHFHRLTQSVIDYSYAKHLNRFGKKLHVHLAIDTGMHRLGIRCENLDEIRAVYRMKNLLIDGIFTHLCVSDSLLHQDRMFTETQIQAFYQVIDILREQGYACRGLHILASYGILNLLEAPLRDEQSAPRQADVRRTEPKAMPVHKKPSGSENGALHAAEYSGGKKGSHGLQNQAELAADYVRPGIALYGVLSNKADSSLWRSFLRPVLSLKARVSSVRPLYAGEATGYGAAFTAKRDMKIATISIGYADGLPRELSYGKGSVLINGYRAVILGRICMDQTIVDVSRIPRIQSGDTVVIIGKSGSLENTADSLATQCGTITNEFLSRLGGRLDRVIIPPQ